MLLLYEYEYGCGIYLPEYRSCTMYSYLMHALHFTPKQGHYFTARTEQIAEEEGCVGISALAGGTIVHT